MISQLRDLLAKFGGPPVNIEAVIRGLGVELDKKAILDPEISGQIQKLEGGKYRISANATDNYLRQRFTLAHELGHYLLHRELIGDELSEDRAYRSTDKSAYANSLIGPAQEIEANRFAARILMPADKVAAEAVDAPSLDALAKRFQVSKRAMEIRLQSLGLHLGN